MSDSNEIASTRRNAKSQYQPRLSAIAVLVVAFIAGAFLMLRSSSPTSSASQSVVTLPSSSGQSNSNVTTVTTKAKVSVQVANGTNTVGLARTYTQQLLTLGWDTLPEMNGPKVASTIIYYNPGYANAASEIASEINASSSSVQPLNGQQPVAGSSTDDVIVILGPDLAIKG